MFHRAWFPDQHFNGPSFFCHPFLLNGLTQPGGQPILHCFFKFQYSWHWEYHFKQVPPGYNIPRIPLFSLPVLFVFISLSETDPDTPHLWTWNDTTNNHECEQHPVTKNMTAVQQTSCMSSFSSRTWFYFACWFFELIFSTVLIPWIFLSTMHSGPCIL